jgi:RNA polymerase sigma factor (sigma-70 family)
MTAHTVLTRDLVMEAKRGDPESRAAHVDEMLPLIGSVARIYRGSPGVARGELMQEGVVGVLRALERYDPAFGTPFWAYASWWVRQAMQQLVAELTRPVVLSDRAARQLARIRTARRTHLQAQGHEPTQAELAAEAGLPPRQVDKLIIAERTARGLDEPIGGADGMAGTFADAVADPRAEEAYDFVLSGAQEDNVRTLLADLNERERTILRGRFGLDGPALTLRQLAARLGVSAERVRQIERGALDKLRTAVETADK